jgi:predicted acyltransferase
MVQSSDRIPPGRVYSIDALRGFDMFWIIGGGTFFEHAFTLIGAPFTLVLARQLEHSSWNGFTFEDLIFPLFIFIMGLTIPFALSKRIERGDSRKAIVSHIVQRAFILLVFGLIFNGLLDFKFEEMRWMGVLQRIALCYLAAALIFVYSGVRGRVIWTTALLLGYWAVMMLVPVPGYGAGVLTPEGNFASWLDRLLIPGKFCCFGSGENEGVLSTFPAVASALIGMLCADWLRTGRSEREKTRGLIFTGAGGIVLGLVWGFAFPINKLIWTSSYTLFAAGWSILLLAAFYWIIDVRGWRRWAFFFTVIGLNPITIYMAQRIFDFGAVAAFFIHGFSGHLGGTGPSFTALGELGVKWLFLWFLFRQKMFLKV